MSLARPRRRTPSSAASSARLSHRPPSVTCTYAATSASAHTHQPVHRSGHALHVPLGSLVPIRLRCSSSHSWSRHTPPPGTSYWHTRRPGSCAVSCVSIRCSAACLSGLRSGRLAMEELRRDVKETQVSTSPSLSNRDRSKGYAVSGESYVEY